MEHRNLGSSGLSVAAVGLGCMGMSEFYGVRDDVESVATLRDAVDRHGIDFLDTADMYGMGHNEELLGRFLREAPGRRGRVRLATKFGIRRSADESGYVRIVDTSAAYVREACDASLRRLGIETIDLYYAHRINPQVPIEETVGAMADLVRAGKVRHLGLSEVSAGTLRRAHAVHPITAVQSEYSLWTRDPETGVPPTCRELGVGFVAYSPLGRGFLTGTISSTDELAPDDFRRLSPRFQDEALAANLTLARRVAGIAGELSISPAQLAIAWVLHQAPFIVAIPGTKRRRYLADNAGAATVHLDAATLNRLAELFPADAACGARYPDAGMQTLNK